MQPLHEEDQKHLYQAAVKLIEAGRKIIAFISMTREEELQKNKKYEKSKKRW